MTGQEMFDKITDGDVFLAYVNDMGNTVIARTNESMEVVRLITEEGAKVIPFESMLKCYNTYKSYETKDISFSDWIIGEV